MIRVIIADDMPRVRGALQLLLGQQPTLNVIGEITRPGDLVQGVQMLHPDLLLLDWELAGNDTPRLLWQLRRMNQHFLIIALSSQPEARDKALAAGADAFISKGDSPEHVLNTLLSVSLR